MATIEIRFNFSRGFEFHTDCDEFEVDSGLEMTIDDRMDEMLSALNEDLADDEDEWEFDELEIECYDDDFADPADFSNFDAYGEYVEKCEEHGEGYRLRFDDIGLFDFNDQYNGCWRSEEEFGYHLIDECYDIPDFLAGYIDYEKWTRDVMMDYSSYAGDEGIHIFRDH